MIGLVYSITVLENKGYSNKTITALSKIIPLLLQNNCFPIDNNIAAVIHNSTAVETVETRVDLTLLHYYHGFFFLTYFLQLPILFTSFIDGLVRTPASLILSLTPSNSNAQLLDPFDFNSFSQRFGQFAASKRFASLF